MAASKTSGNWPAWLKPAGLLLFLLGGLLAFRALGGAQKLLAAAQWIHGAGIVGVIAFVAIFVLATVLLFPASALTLGAGFAWGPLVGFAVVLPTAVLAATTAFALSRSAARGWIERRVAANPRFRAIDEAVGRGGFRLVVLLRLSPIVPFNLLNPTLGLTRVSLRDFVLGSTVGMAPGALLYLYLGSLVTSASQLLSGERPSAGTLGTALYLLGLGATLTVTIWVSRVARRTLASTLEADGDRPAP